MRARAPASSANLGPGFDVLAVALELHVEVEVRPAPCLAIVNEHEGAGLPVDGEHLAVRVVREVLGHDDVEIVIDSNIPLGRGLGSSAALAVATAAAAGAEDPLEVASRLDGHAENAAASMLGGLVAATMVAGRPLARRLALDPGLAFVVVIPDRELKTSKARAVLPRSVSMADAVANLGRMGLLVAGLADRAELVAAAGEDRLHQPARTELFPESVEILARLARAGARVTCWSGAGPSLLAVCDSKALAQTVREAGERALEATGVAGRAIDLACDTFGLVLTN